MEDSPTQSTETLFNSFQWRTPMITHSCRHLVERDVLCQNALGDLTWYSYLDTLFAPNRSLPITSCVADRRYSILTVKICKQSKRRKTHTTCHRTLMKFLGLPSYKKPLNLYWSIPSNLGHKFQKLFWISPIHVIPMSSGTFPPHQKVALIRVLRSINAQVLLKGGACTVKMWKVWEAASCPPVTSCTPMCTYIY